MCVFRVAHDLQLNTARTPFFIIFCFYFLHANMSEKLCQIIHNFLQLNYQWFAKWHNRVDHVSSSSIYYQLSMQFVKKKKKYKIAQLVKLLVQKG